jgi:hypothetical protein
LAIVTHGANCRNKTAYTGQPVEYLDVLPDGAEPLTQAHGRDVAAGHYRHNRDYFVEVGRQYRRLTRSRNNRNSWCVKVRGPDGQRITISWTD